MDRASLAESKLNRAFDTMETIQESETETGRVICPRSLHGLDDLPLAEGYKLHFVTPEELQANGGVCAQCRARIIKFNRRDRVVKDDCPDHIGEHIEFDRPDFAPDTDGGFSPEDGAVPAVEFSFDEIDALLGTIHKTPRDARKQAAELFRQIMAWCFAGNPPLQTALVKVVSVTAGLRPELLGDRTLEELAKKIGVTKQAMSKSMLTFGDEFNFHFTRGRSQKARENMAAAMTGNQHRRRKQTEPEK
jgi:hypothetical protein